MVVVNSGDHAHFWRDHIGAVKASAQANFNHGYVHRFVGEMLQTNRGHDLKECRLLVQLQRGLGHLAN